ncbi:MAG: LCP family protein [Firmicutes bacterium]|nr:LCP family protein [Bacillota bacterium]
MRRSRRNENKRQQRKRRLYLVGAVLLVVIVFSGCLAWSHLRNPLEVLKPNNPGEDWDIADNFDKDVVNFLFMGFDRNEARDRIYTVYRPDTMILVSINFREDEMTMLSIPRDSYVKIAGRETYDKINAAYMYGHEYGMEGIRDPHAAGIRCTIKTVEELLGGVPIHYYVAVDMDGVVEIVDKLDGIYYDVEAPVLANNGRLLVDKGYQKLDGRKYLYYCRDRRVGGDIGRTQRQQKLLIATFKQLKQAGKLVKLPQVYKSLKETVDTDLNFSQIASLALYAREIEPEDIGSHVLAGSTQWAPRGELDICYLVIDEAARVSLIKELFGVEVEARPQIYLPGPRVRPPVENGSEQGLQSGEETPEPPTEGLPEGEDWGGPVEHAYEEPEDNDPDDPDEPLEGEDGEEESEEEEEPPEEDGEDLGKTVG